MKIKSIVFGVAVAALAVTVPATTTFAGFFPADRPTYTCGATRPDGTTPCEGADHVVFNSFTNNPVVGDERPFFAGSLNGANVQDRIKVNDGNVITLRAFVHNNADPNKIGEAAALAKNVRIRVLIPNDNKADHNLVAFIRADNANPGTINDTMSLFGDRTMTLSYVPGSAKFAHAPDGVNTQTVALDDGIVSSNGASLGGIHGCFQYSGYVTLQVKVTMPTPPTPPQPPTPTPTPPAPVKPVVVTPTSLPNTGAGEVAAIGAVASIAGALGYRRLLLRRAAK